MVAGRRAVNGAADLPVASPRQGRLPAPQAAGKKWHGPLAREGPDHHRQDADATWPRRDIFYATIKGTTESGV